MKIRRFIAKDMRAALKQVREEQGPDAVIMSSRNIGEGVEVVAAIDFDPDMHREAEASGQFDTFAAHASDTNDFAHLLERSITASEAAAAPQAAMSAELNELRRMLETQLSMLAWNDLTRRAPVHTEVLRELTKLGLTQSLSAELVTQLPARCELVEGQRMALGLLAHRVLVANEPWMDRGGMVALVGATGVGKTLTLAKIAARWVLRHGARDLALVSADGSRIGAQDQLHSIGRLLGAPCYAVDGVHELPSLLADLDNRRLVLIDTAGVSQRDERLSSELSALADAHSRLETALVLSGNAQALAIEETIVRFAPARPKCGVLTKLDEAASLGGALSALIRSRLPLAYICDGQRYAEDIKPARAHQLVVRAVQLTRGSGAAADEDLLSRRFGGIAHALA